MSHKSHGILICKILLLRKCRVSKSWSKVMGTIEVLTILAKYLHWDRAPHRLKLPALSRDGLVIHNHINHINPSSWCGNVNVSQVVLQTCWKLGRRRIEEDFPFVTPILQVATDSTFNIFVEVTVLRWILPSRSFIYIIAM